MSGTPAALSERGPAKFPLPRGRMANMMPVIHGDVDSVPRSLRAYAPMMSGCDFAEGTTVYLTVHESTVLEGEYQRRPGAHVESPAALGWGGGNWGGCKKGLYMASTDGACRVWDCLRFDGDKHGALAGLPDSEAIRMAPRTLYWLTDRTPHEALKAASTGVRQFFRLVSEDIGGWWTEHNTPNPLGVLPAAPLLYGNKFAEGEP